MKKQTKIKIEGLQLTLIDWFSLLNEDIKKEVITEMQRQGRGYQIQTSQAISLRRAMGKFDWASSQQGTSYWSKITNPDNIRKYINPHITQNF